MLRIQLLIRARSDRVRYVVGHDAALLICAVGVLVGIVAALPIFAGIAVSLMALAFGGTKLVRGVCGVRRQWAPYDFAAVAGPFPVADLRPPVSYTDAIYVQVPNRGTGLVSESIDRVLINGGLPFAMAQPYRLPPKLRATAPYVLARSSRHRVVFNGTAVGMHGDPLHGGSKLMLHQAVFYDLLCSNEIFTYQITDRRTGVPFDPCREFLADATGGRLRLLADSELSDLIGVSTLAITSDDHLLLVRQSGRNLASAGLLAPSGSGSLEPRDLDGASTLQEALCRSMERELREETGLPADHIRNTQVVGFARWMDRGAKPEFFGLTRLAGTADELALARPASDERLFSTNIKMERMNLGVLRQQLAEGIELHEASSLPGCVRDQGALPLLLALRAAALVREPATAADGPVDSVR